MLTPVGSLCALLSSRETATSNKNQPNVFCSKEGKLRAVLTHFLHAQFTMAGLFGRSSAKKQNIMMLNERSQTKRKTQGMCCYHRLYSTTVVVLQTHV